MMGIGDNLGGAAALTAQTDAQALAMIEARIQSRKSNIVHEFYGLGDDLNEAKQRGVVPHGTWEDWATSVTGLSIRTVQRLMQAAREVPMDKRIGSSLGQLEFRQLSAVLALPEGERDAMADEAVAKGLSSREVEERVRVAAAAAAAQARKETEALSQHKIRALQDVAEQRLTALDDKEAALRDTVARVQELQNLIASSTPLAAPAMDSEQEAEIHRLEAELTRSRTLLEVQSQQRREAQQALFAAQAQMTRAGDTADVAVGLTLAQFAEAARAFVGRCGALPHMQAQLMHMPKREREEWESAVAMVQVLLDGARSALNMIDGGVIHG